MKQDELYDPTVKTTVDELNSTIANPGRLIEGENDVFPLDRALILIGGDDTADIVVDGCEGADYVAEIIYENGLYVLRALEERCVVSLGSRPIQERVLADGDVIHLSGRTFTYKAPRKTTPLNKQ